MGNETSYTVDLFEAKKIFLYNFLIDIQNTPITLLIYKYKNGN